MVVKCTDLYAASPPVSDLTISPNMCLWFLERLTAYCIAIGVATWISIISLLHSGLGVLTPRQKQNGAQPS